MKLPIPQYRPSLIWKKCKISNQCSLVCVCIGSLIPGTSCASLYFTTLELPKNSKGHIVGKNHGKTIILNLEPNPCLMDSTTCSPSLRPIVCDPRPLLLILNKWPRLHENCAMNLSCGSFASADFRISEPPSKPSVSSENPAFSFSHFVIQSFFFLPIFSFNLLPCFSLCLQPSAWTVAKTLLITRISSQLLPPFFTLISARHRK